MKRRLLSSFLSLSLVFSLSAGTVCASPVDEDMQIDKAQVLIQDAESEIPAETDLNVETESENQVVISENQETESENQVVISENQETESENQMVESELQEDESAITDGTDFEEEELETEETLEDESASADATSGTCGTSTRWELVKNDDETYTLNITGTGPMQNYQSNAIKPWDYRSGMIKEVVIKEGVTSIGNYAFEGLYQVKQVIVPEGVTSIGTRAFAYCNSLGRISLPETLQSIGANAFKDDALLHAIYYIGDELDWESVSIDASNDLSSRGGLVNTLSGICGDDAYFSLFDYRDGVGYNLCFFGEGRLYDYTAESHAPWYRYADRIVETSISYGINYIGAYTYDGCNQLLALNIPSNITEVGDYAFTNCYSLEMVAFSKNIQSIGKNVFENSDRCNTLLYAGTETEWQSVFVNPENRDLNYSGKYYNAGICGDTCYYYITYPDGVCTLNIDGRGAIRDYVVVCAPWDEWASSIERLVIGYNITSIGREDFFQASSLKDVIIKGSVTYIGTSAFADCTSLKEMILPEGLTGIPAKMFSDCESMRRVYIPLSVEELGPGCFTGCSGLTDVYYGGTKAQWSKLINTLESQRDRMELYNATIHFQTGFCGEDTYYHLNQLGDQSYELEIFGTGAMYSFWTSAAPWQSFLSEITSVKVGEGITVLGDGAFMKAYNLTSVSLPESLVEIGLGPFSETAITELTIPAGVKVIKSWVFANTIPLTDVYYMSTEADWNKIEFGPMNPLLPNIMVHFLEENDDPIITGQPRSISAGVKGTATFTVEAEHAASYQWQYSKDGIKWYNSAATGAKTDTMSFTVSKSNSVNMFRCKITGTNGDVVYTENAEIDLIPGAKITMQPESCAVTMGTDVKFTIAAENIPLARSAFQWQYSKDGVKWYNSGAEGNTSQTLTVKAASNTAASMYRCKVLGLDDNWVISSSVAFVILTEQPKNSDAKTGETATFSLKAENVVSYQWQYSKDDEHWYNSGATGNTTDTISFKVTSTARQNSYRCKLETTTGIIAVTNPVGFDEGVKIVIQPEVWQTCIGGPVYFHCETSELKSLYQWQYSKDGVKWMNSNADGAKTDTLTFTAAESNKNNLYRCKITCTDGSVLYTREVRIYA